jgi:hypothetical protein
VGVEKLVNVPAHGHEPAQLQPRSGLEHEPEPEPEPALEPEVNQWLGLEPACKLEPGLGLDPTVAKVCCHSVARP